MFSVSIFSAVAMIQAAAPTAPAEVPTRQVVENVTGAIEANYFDPAVAGRIAAQLRREAQAGSFDNLSPPRLAAALTRVLEPYDQHFHVRYMPEASPAAISAGAARASEYGPEEQSRRSGFGIRQVSVLPGNIGYIDLRSFAPIDFSNPEWPSRLAMNAALAMVARTDALVIDLRNNNGGDPGMVGYFVSAFIDPRRDVFNVFRARRGEQSEAPPAPFAGRRLDMPVYILTSRRTGSAPEGFAYTMQAAGRAQIVGEPSVGAANPGDDVILPGGYRVFVSIASPRNPITGTNWEGTGVQPNVGVPEDQALTRGHILALEAALSSIPPVERIDTEWTLAALRAQANPRTPAAIEAYTGQYETVRVLASAGGLAVQSGARAIALAWLEGDLFVSSQNPAVRYAFRRDASGRITALELIRMTGAVSQFNRSG